MVMYYRKLPLFKGKSKLARLLFKKNIRKAKDVWVRGKYGCKYLLPNLVENVSFDIYVNGIYEQDTLEFLADMSSRFYPAAKPGIQRLHPSDLLANLR